MKNDPIINSSDVVIFLIAGVLVIGLMASFIIYFLISYRQKKKDFELLTSQKEEIGRQKIELENTLIQLKSAQVQLIQSEKMASLGELTAGIAHEIKNPLNFINNFSELNKELIDELKDGITKGNTDTVLQIANDISSNEDKINHHGKRADAIVKGMLQHSRSSTGIKELTDINALCDEYIRLSYHGLKAKDKSFNTTIQSNFDPNIKPIPIISQDIGRVILNLLTNAFYAVNVKRNDGIPGYNPSIAIVTKKLGNDIIIKVSDNGYGIKAKDLDKIFLPFYTTKPSGEGTGLGLSLSFDIVTKGHGGNLSVETKDGEGTTFIITLPT